MLTLKEISFFIFWRRFFVVLKLLVHGLRILMELTLSPIFFLNPKKDMETKNSVSYFMGQNLNFLV